MGLAGARFSVDDLAAAGVRRISVGSALRAAALGAFLRAAREVREHGTFSFADDAASFAEIDAFMRATDLSGGRSTRCDCERNATAVATDLRLVQQAPRLSAFDVSILGRS